MLRSKIKLRDPTVKRREEMLVPLPPTVEQVYEEWSRMGGTTESAHMQQGRGALLTYSLSSAHLNRSHRKCVVVLVGETGVGKSSLLNHVFNMKLSKVSDRTSETKSVIEFTSKLDIPRLGVSDLAVSMVDTPGLCDTEGLDQDARNVFAIQKYLNMEIGPGKLPNLILLLVRATDNRILGEQSRLSKMIACLKMLKIVDNQHCNLMVVFTHACHIHGKSARSKLQEKKEIVQELMRMICGMEVPVVFIENDPKEYDLDFDEKSGTSQLPSGEIQPHHLFQAMMEMMNQSGDDLGNVAIKETYARGDQSQMSLESCRVDANTKKTGPLNKEEARIRKQLEDSGDKTEIEMMMDAKLATMGLEKSIERELKRVCSNLVRDHGLVTAREVQQFSKQQLNFLLASTVSSNSLDALAEIFSLSQSKLKPVATASVGRGFDLTQNRTKTAPLLINAGPKVEKIQKTQAHTATLNSAEEFVAYYLNTRGIPMDVNTVNYRNVEIGELNVNTSAPMVNCVMENQVLFVRLPEMDSLEFTPDFIAAVKKLPDEFDFDNPSMKKQFEDFVGVWGTHVIFSGFCGGSLQLSGSLNSSNKEQTVSLIGKKLDALAAGTSDFGSDCSSIGQLGLSLKWIGGDSVYHKTDLAQVDAKLTRDWKTSVVQNMEFLPHHVELLPLQKLMEKAGFDKKAEAFSDAMVEKLQGTEAAGNLRKHQEKIVREAEEKRKREQEIEELRKQQSEREEIMEQERNRVEEERRQEQQRSTEERERMQREMERLKMESENSAKEIMRQQLEMEREARQRQAEESQRREEMLREELQNQQEQRMQEMRRMELMRREEQEKTEQRHREEMEKRERETTERLQKLGQTRSEAAGQVDDPEVNSGIWYAVKTVASTLWNGFKRLFRF